MYTYMCGHVYMHRHRFILGNWLMLIVKAGKSDLQIRLETQGRVDAAVLGSKLLS
jgi:hypothetical protein